MDTEVLVVLPILLPFVAAAVSMLLWRWPRAQRIVGVIGTGSLLVVAISLLVTTYSDGIMAMQVSGFVAPFGIVLVSDLLSSTMVVMTGLMGFAIALYSLATAGEEYERFGYFPLIHILLAGVSGAFLTGDIFNLYVWFEVMLVASFALLILGGKRGQMEGAVKYVTINLIASAILLSAIGLTYGLLGTLNMAHIAEMLPVIFEGEAEGRGMLYVVAAMFMVAFGIKAGAFPLFFWLPASYHTPPVAVSGLFAGLLTKVGVYALYRFFTLLFSPELSTDFMFFYHVLMWGGALTMITGVLAAAAMFETRRILSAHIISQVGYMITAIGLVGFSQTDPNIPAEIGHLAIAGGIFYMVQHIIVKTNLFLVSGVVYRLLGSYKLKKLGGLYRKKPFLALMFFIPALSLAGLPPLSGFFAKFAVIRAAVESYQPFIVAAALITGALTLYSMLKIWKYAFWRPTPEDNPNTDNLDEPYDADMRVMLAPIVLLSGCTLVLGLYAQPFFEVTFGAAEQMLDSTAYIEAVGLEYEIDHPLGDVDGHHE